MSIVTTSYIRDVANIPLNSVPDGRISVFFPPAETRLRKWVGDVAYDDAADDTPADEKRAAALKYAEAQLVIAAGLSAWNMAHTGTGIAASRDGGAQSKGLVMLTPEQIKQIRDAALEEAARSAKPYSQLGIQGPSLIGCKS
jgi:hypothetical protein